MRVTCNQLFVMALLPGELTDINLFLLLSLKVRIYIYKINGSLKDFVQIQVAFSTFIL